MDQPRVSEGALDREPIARVVRAVTRSLLLIAASVLATVLVFELGLRLVRSTPHPYTSGTASLWWKSPPNRYVASSHIQAERIFRPDPKILSGLGQQVRFTTNEFGFRTPRLVSVEKGESETRVFAVGGSTTECLYLDDEDAWPEVLQRRLGAELARLDVINVGHSGDGTREHIALLAQRVVPFEPDVVLFLVGINDLNLQFAPDYSILRTGSRSHLEIPEPGLGMLLKSRLADLSHLARAAVWARRRFVHEARGGNPIQDEYGGWVDKKREDWRALPLVQLDPVRFPGPEYEQNLRTLIGITRANGAEPVLLTQPVIWGAEPGEWEDRLWAARTRDARLSHAQAWEILERFNEVTRRVAREVDVLLVDLARIVPKDPELFYDDDHLTIAGARVVGEAVADAFERAQWRRCLLHREPAPKDGSSCARGRLAAESD